MPRSPRPADLYRMRIATEPRLSPDGRFAIVALTTSAPRRDGYRTALTELQLEQPPTVHLWPWPDRSPGDWTLPVDPERPQLPTLVMTPAEISAIGIPEASGGLLNLLLQGPDGKVYTLAVRPLLPDEED